MTNTAIGLILQEREQSAVANKEGCGAAKLNNMR
jgi:hypothetical protein